MGLMVKKVRDAASGLARTLKWAKNKVFLDGGKTACVFSMSQTV